MKNSIIFVLNFIEGVLLNWSSKLFFRSSFGNYKRRMRFVNIKILDISNHHHIHIHRLEIYSVTHSHLLLLLLINVLKRNEAGHNGWISAMRSILFGQFKYTLSPTPSVAADTRSITFDDKILTCL